MAKELVRDLSDLLKLDLPSPVRPEHRSVREAEGGVIVLGEHLIQKCGTYDFRRGNYVNAKGALVVYVAAPDLLTKEALLAKAKKGKKGGYAAGFKAAISIISQLHETFAAEPLPTPSAYASLGPKSWLHEAAHELLRRIYCPDFDVRWKSESEKLSEPERLALLGMTKEQVLEVCYAFIGSWLPHDMRKVLLDGKQEKNWSRSPRKLGFVGVMDHFLHRRQAVATADWFVGRRGRVLTRRIRFDIDVHTEAQRATLVERYRRVRALFPDRTPLVFSTPGGGLDVWFISARPVPLDVLRDDVRMAMNHHGIFDSDAPGPKDQSGYDVEIFPKLGLCRRLPLGPGSELLDAETLKPIATTVKEFYEIWKNTDIEQTATSADLIRELRAGHNIRRSVRKKTRGARGSRALQEGRMLLRNGLQVHGQRFQAMFKVMLALKEKGHHGEELVFAALAWQHEKSNGFASSHLTDPEENDREIRRLIKLLGKCHVEIPVLSEEALELIFDLERGIHDRAREDGRKSRFEILARVLNYVAGKQRRDKGRQVVELPVNAFYVDGASRNRSSCTYGPTLLRALVSNGVLRPVGPRPRPGQCQLYEVVWFLEYGEPVLDLTQSIRMTWARHATKKAQPKAKRPTGASLRNR